MRTTAFLAVSLDGYIARPDGGLDWLPVPPEGEDYGFHAFMDEVDAVVMGRTTFEVVLGFEGPWPYDKPVVVLTTRALDLPAELEGRVLVAGGEPAHIRAHLAERGLERLYIDGGDTMHRFLMADQLDRLVISRVPLVLGSGISLFRDTGRDLPLIHRGTHAFEDGLVQSVYDVIPAQAQAPA